jgi:hypothetical protein
VIFRTRYLQLARVDNLEPGRFARLTMALTEDLELWHAWKLLQQLFESPTRTTRTRPRCGRVTNGRLEGPRQEPARLGLAGDEASLLFGDHIIQTGEGESASRATHAVPFQPFLNPGSVAR